MAGLSSDTVRLLYTWMLSHLDVNGNFYADPVMVNNLVFTRLGHSVKTISTALDELSDKRLIVRYQINGEAYLNYPDFLEKQLNVRPLREGVPDIPELTPESLQTNSGVTPTQVKVKVKVKVKNKDIVNPDFEIFWKAYPRKVNKREAQDKWEKVSLPTIEFLLNAIELQKKSEQWMEADGKYIPHPTTWINRERWNDELKPYDPKRNIPGDRRSLREREIDAEAERINTEYEKHKASKTAATKNTGQDAA